MRRLETIQSLIRPGIGTIDVGTDHGLLPIALAKQGYAGNLIASDIHSQPLQAARRNAAAEGGTQRSSASAPGAAAERIARQSGGASGETRAVRRPPCSA